jgi:hypothetical protein
MLTSQIKRNISIVIFSERSGLCTIAVFLVTNLLGVHTILYITNLRMKVKLSRHQFI